MAVDSVGVATDGVVELMGGLPYEGSVRENLPDFIIVVSIDFGDALLVNSYITGEVVICLPGCSDNTLFIGECLRDVVGTAIPGTFSTVCGGVLFPGERLWDRAIPLWVLRAIMVTGGTRATATTCSFLVLEFLPVPPTGAPGLCRTRTLVTVVVSLPVTWLSGLTCLEPTDTTGGEVGTVMLDGKFFFLRVGWRVVSTTGGTNGGRVNPVSDSQGQHSADDRWAAGVDLGEVGNAVDSFDLLAEGSLGNVFFFVSVIRGVGPRETGGDTANARWVRNASLI